jgi:hypothetical protein
MKYNITHENVSPFYQFLYFFEVIICSFIPFDHELKVLFQSLPDYVRQAGMKRTPPDRTGREPIPPMAG